jgi:hypothetical protein
MNPAGRAGKVFGQSGKIISKGKTGSDLLGKDGVRPAILRFPQELIQNFASVARKLWVERENSLKESQNRRSDPHLRLTNSQGARNYQLSVRGSSSGPYNENTNSCMTHVLRVLQAGGINVPEEAFKDMKAAQDFLESFRNR